jgi:outer membrane protein assembly factor BamE (lipoprotein component of BamABCDE complex)
MVIARVMAFALLVSLSACGGFDKEQWASGKGNFDGESPRDSMVSDAEKAGVKIGATRASIRALLGEPDGTDPEGDVWYLGRGYYVPDNQRLEILYDKNDIAIKVSVLRT